MFVKFTIVQKPWHCRHMCCGPDGYRRSPLHQDAPIWPKAADLAGTVSKQRNLVVFLRFCPLQFFNNSQACHREVVPDTVIYTDTEIPKQNRGIVSSRCATVAIQSFFGLLNPNKPNTFQLNSSTAHCARLLFAHKV